MECVAALGIVCNVLQVSDYAFRLVAKGHGIHQSVDVASKENRSMETCAKELFLRNARLVEALRNSKSTGELSADDEALKALGVECSSIAKELIELLTKLRRSDVSSKSKSMRQALKASWNKEKVNGIAQRMKHFQDQMNSAMLQSLRYFPALSGSSALSPLFRQPTPKFNSHGANKSVYAT